MEGADQVRASVEVELFGEKKVIEPTFDILLTFEELAKTSLLDPSHWSPFPKITSAAILFWAAIGGRKSGKTVKDVHDQLDTQKLGAAVALALLYHDQYKAIEKKEPAA